MTGDPLPPETLRRLRELVRAPSPAAEPTGRYRKETRLGEGGMGEVWKAWDAQLGRWVALKLLKGAGADEVARFEREALTAARLSHPHIVPIHDVGELDGRRFISMEFIEGETLGTRAMEPREAARIVRDAAQAVHHAHGQGVIHRDLKPQNLMVDRTGHAWVTDFGLARSVASGTTLTATGAVVGTPAYMAPEQAMGLRCTERSDVHSLGATLYFLLTGEPPFAGENAIEVLDRVRQGDPRPPRATQPGLPADLDTITLKAMEKDPRRRYATAAELADDLGRWLDGEPVVARPPSPARRWAARLRKHPTAYAVGGVCALAGIAAALVVGLRYAEARRLGEQGVDHLRNGRFVEARSALDRSVALWRIERYERDLAKVNETLARRVRADRLAVLCDDTLRALDEEVRRAEEVGLGGRPLAPEEEAALLQRVEAQVEALPDPAKRSSLPHAIRGWALCNLGRVTEGERELNAAPAESGDRYGTIFRLWWCARAACREIDPACLSSGPRPTLPPELVDELAQASREMAPPPGATPLAMIHPGAHHRHLIHGLAGAALGDRGRLGRSLDGLASHADLRADVLLFHGIVRALAGDLDVALGALRDSQALRPRCMLGWRWLGEVEMALGRFDAAAVAFETAAALAAPEIEAVLRERLRLARTGG